MKEKIFRTVVSSLLVLGLIFSVPTTVKASTSITPADLIAMVNGWRVGTYGFSPLIEDPILDGTAQYTAQLMADNHYTNHIVYLGYAGVSERVAAAGYNNGVVTCATENWAYSYTSLSEIDRVWQDEQHQYPASKEQYKRIGAGVAVDSAGVPWYIVHAACDSSGDSAGSFETTQGPNSTRIPTTDNSIHLIVTATPQLDGAVYHTVEAGQTLWSIAVAYGTHIDILKALNHLNNDIVIVGTKLLISEAPLASVSPTGTQTTIPPTRTPTRPSTPKPPTTTITQRPSPTPTKEAAFAATSSRHNLGMTIIVICGIGLLAVIALTFFRRPTNAVNSREKEN